MDEREKEYNRVDLVCLSERISCERVWVSGSVVDTTPACRHFSEKLRVQISSRDCNSGTRLLHYAVITTTDNKQQQQQNQKDWISEAMMFAYH